MRLRSLFVLVAAVLGVVAAWPGVAHAAFPGQNGDLLFRCANSGATTCVSGADGSEWREWKADAAAAAWSPGGGRVAYLGDHQSELRVADADGSDDELLTDVEEHGSYGAQLAWSPDGAAIAYECGVRICRIDLVSRVVKVLSDTEPGSGSWDTSPAWSPDGARIVFLSDRDQSLETCARRSPLLVCQTSTRPFVMDADGSDEQPLLADDVAGSADTPDWHPGGESVAFTLAGAVVACPVPADAPCRAEDRLAKPTTADGLSGGVQWSPDGTRLITRAGTRSDAGFVVVSLADCGGFGLDGVGALPDWQAVGAAPASFPAWAGREPCTVTTPPPAPGWPPCPNAAYRTVCPRPPTVEKVNHVVTPVGDPGFVLSDPRRLVVPLRMTLVVRRRSARSLVVSGRVVLAAADRARGCGAGGTVAVRVRRGQRLVRARNVRLGADCRYRAVVRVRSRARVTVTARFLGNAVLDGAWSAVRKAPA